MKIKNIELEIGRKTINLTVEQAKELRDILNETFPEDTTVVHEHHNYERPYRAPYQYWGTPFWYTGTANIDGVGMITGNNITLTATSNTSNITSGTLKLVANG